MAAENALIASLRERVVRVESARKAARRSSWMQVVLGIFLFVLCLPWIGGVALGSVWTLGNVLVQDPSPLLVGVVLFGAAAIAIWLLYLFARALFRWVGDANPAYEQAFREHVVLPSLGDALPGVSPMLDGPVTMEDFDASSLFLPKADDFSAPYGFTGKAGSVTFRGSMLDVRKWSYSNERKMRIRVPYFRGIFVHIAGPMPLPGTLRLVHLEVYEGWNGQQWGVERRGATVKTQSGNPQFDALAAVVLDEQSNGMPPVPAALLQAWLGLDASIGKPVFLALNQTGVYLTVATGTERLPLEPRVQFANRPEELAEELELLRKVVQGVETLRRALAIG